jgi:phosphate transport system protein
MTTHLQRQFDRLRKMILSVGALAEESLHQAIRAINERDVDLARQVIADDRKVDMMEVEVEEECLHTLALYQPFANDLRFLIAVLKINNDLERIADLATKLAEQGIFLASKPELGVIPFDMAGMVERAGSMLRKSLDALVSLDSKLAREVLEQDDEVDRIHESMYSNVIQAIKEDPERLEQYIHLINISRTLERIADYTVNISEDVLYISGGDIVRHGGHTPHQED